MPVLPNPRHEAFARAIFATTCDPKLYPTHGHAYNAAGYRARDAGKAGGSAEVNACNLLKKTKIAERVRELQEQAAERAGETADKCVQELNQLRKDAHSDKAYGAAVAAVMGKAKILNSLSINMLSYQHKTSQLLIQCTKSESDYCSRLASPSLTMHRSGLPSRPTIALSPDSRRYAIVPRDLPST